MPLGLQGLEQLAGGGGVGERHQPQRAIGADGVVGRGAAASNAVAGLVLAVPTAAAEKKISFKPNPTRMTATIATA